MESGIIGVVFERKQIMKKKLSTLRYLPLVFLPFFVTGCASTQSTGNAALGTEAGTPGDFAANVGDTVLFDFNDYSVHGEAEETLRRQAAWLAQYPQYKIMIEGHTDARGTREYNLALGQRRAVAVRKFLESQGVDPSRISTVSYGKGRPVSVCDDESGWQQNRRSVTTLQ